MNRFRLLLGIICVGLVTNLISASAADKVQTERHLADKAQHVLDVMYGPNQFAVTVSVDMGAESWRVKYTGRAKIKTTGKKPPQYSDKEFQILPGYHALKNLAPDGKTDVPFNSEITKISPKPKKITVSVIVSKSLAKRDVNKAKKLVSKLLKLNTKKGDSIVIKTETFPILERDIASNVNVTGTPQNYRGVILLGLALFLLFIVFYFFFQFKQAGHNDKVAAQTASSGDGGSSAKSSRSKRKDSVVAQGGSGSLKRYFDFVTDASVASLIHVLKSEKMNPQHIGVVISYLAASLAVEVMSAFSHDEQAKIITAIIDRRVLGRENLDKIEETIRGKVECMIGGTDVVDEMINEISNNDKKELLKSLESDKNSYAKVRPHVLLYDDMSEMTDPEVKLMLSNVGLETLSTSFMGAEESTKEMVMKNMSESAREMLLQFQELRSHAMSEDEIDLAQSEVMNSVHQLEKEGRIKLMSRLAENLRSGNRVKKSIVNSKEREK